MNPFAASPERWISPSLNRVRLAGDAIPAGLRGTIAYNILSAAALRRGIREAAPALRLSPDLPDGELLPALERSFTATAPAVWEAARVLAGSYGRGLAYLLLALHEGASLPAAGGGSGTPPTARPETSALRAAIRPDWQERHWRFWSQIESAVVGGGLVAGRFGQEMLPAARATLAGEGTREPPLSLELAARPHELVLLGAARYAPAGCRTALAFDFGATAVKRAVVLYEGEQLMRVASFPSRPSLCWVTPHGGMFAGHSAAQLQQMARLMAATWHAAREAGFTPEPVFCVALATYLYRGQPYPQEAGSCYGRLQELGHVPTVLTGALSRLLGMSVELRLLHDGTAAAAVFAGVPRRVVITLGTAIGHGFPPPAGGLRPLGHRVEVAHIQTGRNTSG